MEEDNLLSLLERMEVLVVALEEVEVLEVLVPQLNHHKQIHQIQIMLEILVAINQEVDHMVVAAAAVLVVAVEVVLLELALVETD